MDQTDEFAASLLIDRQAADYDYHRPGKCGKANSQRRFAMKWFNETGHQLRWYIAIQREVFTDEKRQTIIFNRV